MQLLIMIALIALLIYTLWKWFHRKKPSREVVQLRTGVVGSGKTYLSVADARRQYKKVRFRYKLRKWPIIRHFKSFVCQVPPRFYSDIPVWLNKKDGWAEVLTREHLLLQDPFPDDCCPIVLIDEIGLIANQYSYSDINVTTPNINDAYECLEVFIRFFRHYCGENNHDLCRLYCTDQASGGIAIALRRRFGLVDYLSDFRRFLGFMPFYIVDTRTMLLADDNSINTNQVAGSDEYFTEYFMGVLPFRWQNKKNYDTHSYHGTKYTGFVSRVPFTNWSDNDYSYTDNADRVVCNQWQTNYCPDIRMTAQEKADYKARLAQLHLTLNDVKTDAR